MELGESLTHFDAEHYLNIGSRGYLHVGELAFFPLFPIIIAFFNLFKIPLVGIVIFNILLSYLTTILIYKILKEIYNYTDKMIKNILLFWLFSPISLFLIVPYNESLFLFLTILVFYLYKTEQKPIIMGIILGLSVLTRSFGAMLFFSLFIVLALNKNFKIIIQAYIPATIIACIYPIYLYFKTGDFLYFVSVQFTVWNRTKSNIFSVFIKEFQMIQNVDKFIIFRVFNLSLLLLIMFYIIYFIVKSFKNKEPDRLLFALYLIFTLISCFSTMRNSMVTYPSCSFYRYLFSLFPIYLYKKERLLISNSILIFIPVNMILIFMFCNNIFMC